MYKQPKEPFSDRLENGILFGYRRARHWAYTHPILHNISAVCVFILVGVAIGVGIAAELAPFSEPRQVAAVVIIAELMYGLTSFYVCMYAMEFWPEYYRDDELGRKK